MGIDMCVVSNMSNSIAETSSKDLIAQLDVLRNEHASCLTKQDDATILKDTHWLLRRSLHNFGD